MTPQEISAKFQALIGNQSVPIEARQQLAAFLTSGVYPTNSMALRLMQDTLQGTPYADRPGTLAIELRGQPGTAPGNGAGQGGIAESVLGGAPPQATTPSVQGQSILGGPTTAPNGLTGDEPLQGSAALAAQLREAAMRGAQGATRQASTPNDPTNPYAAQSPSMGTDPNTQGLGAPSSALRSQQAIIDDGPGMTGGGGSLPGGFTAAQANEVGTNDDRLVRFAMQAAGLNPDRLTGFSKGAARALIPLLKARRAAFGIAGDGDVGGLPQDIASFAKEFTSGGNFFQNARGYAEQAMNSDNFQNAIAGLSDQEQVAAMYQSLMPLQFAGSNPLIQQAAADTFERRNNQFNDDIFNSSGAGNVGGGIFDQFIKQQQNLDPLTRRIFGIR